MAENSSSDLIKESKEDYLINRIAYAFGIRALQGLAKIKDSLSKDDEKRDMGNRRTVELFLSEKDSAEYMFVLLQGDAVYASLEVPPLDKFKRKGIVLLKIGKEPLTQKNIAKDMLIFEMTKNVLEHLYDTFQEVFSPVLQNPQNQACFTELITKDLMEKFNNYIAQVYVAIGLTLGKTWLPLPSHKLTATDTTPDKDKAHVFESAIIMWTKQIKNVIKQDPEMVLKTERDPGPLRELAFWEKKASNLNSIYEQLQSVHVRNILRFLEGNKSTYTTPFSKLQKDVNQHRMEASDNNKFLKTLKPLFENLENQKFLDIHDLFIPIMHTILLIWKHSKYYNTPPRLVVLIREICNEIIRKAREHVSGQEIFSLITSEETSEACEKLQQTIDICTKFKDAYFEYKSKAEGTWKLTTNALFVRLDCFLERCHDILHLTNTIVQFSKLQKIELGGTKGKTLTETVQQISNEFSKAVDDFKEVKYEIMDTDVKDFDDDFYEFRSKIKELERRLASVITQGFDDCDTIYGRFKLLDSFEGLLTRPIIQDELEKKHIILLESYKQDLKTVQSIFLEGKQLVDDLDEKAPIFNNMPPVAGALTWCHGLQERIKEPIDKLASLGSVIVEREEYKDVNKLYASINKSIDDYKEGKKLAWESNVENTSQEKLKQFLLYKDEQGLIHVNFDPTLVALLREVKYFKLLDQQVPQCAEDIFSKDETYRTQICSLDMIVNNYNHIITCLHPVEEPLIKERIEKMDIALKQGLDDLKWKSQDINTFINNAKGIVDSTFEIVTKMKESIEKVKKCLETINTKILERKNRPMPPDDYALIYTAVFQNRQSIIKENSSSIVKLIREVHEAVRVDKNSPYWRAYLDYVNEIVLEGIATAILTALNHLNEQITPSYIKRNEVNPIFDIRLELNDNQIMYDPPVEENNQGNSVRNFVKGWINDFFQISNFVSRHDRSDLSDFLQETRDYFELKEVIASIYTNLDFIENETNSFKDKFQVYSYLWLNDPKSTFQKFLEDNETPDEVTEEEDGIAQKENPLLKGARVRIPNLDLFDEKITQLKNIQVEIGRINSHIDVAWLKISVLPLKSALDQKVTSWIKVYTEFLVHQVRTTLNNLKEFIKVTNNGINDNPAHPSNVDNKKLLMKVMKIISDVKDVEPKAEGIVKRVKDMVVKLKKHNVNMQDKGEEDPLQAIDNAFSAFNETTQKVFKVKADIIPLQAQETQNIRNELKNFKVKVEEFRARFLKQCPFNYEDGYTFERINGSYKIIDDYYSELIKLDEEKLNYNNLERLFELERTNYKELRDCHSDLKNLKTMWDGVSMVNYQYNDWKSKPWKSIKADTLSMTNQSLSMMVKNLPKEVRNFKGYQVLVDKVKNMATVLPLVSSLHSEFMETRHWAQLMTITGKKFDHKSQNFSFEDILDLELHKFDAQVNEIVDVAQKEARIEKKLKSIESAWTKQIFEFEEYQETKIFKPLDNMMELLDQHSLDLMGMRSQGKYVEHFAAIVEEWREKLSRVEGVVTEWLKVQKNWRVLVNIFLTSEDIKVQLQEETKLFESVDREFREMMNDVSLNPGVVETCTNEKKDVLDTMSTNIKRCEKALNDYLEQKKKSFPRFYFLSNQSLLTILANGMNPPKVCEFIGDCFDGMKSLIFIDPGNSVDIAKVANGMTSKDDEKIPFSSNFICEGPVEHWLSSLELKMRTVLYEILESAKSTSELWDQGGDNSREEWVADYCAQIALLTTQIVWTEDVGRAFEDLGGGSESAMRECQKLIELRIENLIKKVRGKLDRLERMKIINIITIDVHSRDVVEKFANLKVQEPESFAWLSQLKFYWENKEQDMASRQNLRFSWEKDKEKMKCIIKIVDWFRFYSYEYVGNSLRLVITPLTDRCYITLTQALNLTMGGAPAGPAGTGKTETTKDLGRAVGLPVMVFNCSDQMNKDSMAQIFMGLSQSGAWGCFDEFNRISIEVLSVVSTQVKFVLDALKERKTKFQFVEEGEIALVDTCGFFITMNPGYAGRTELPENLKALFRSCAMVVPDLVLICENMLMSEGFSSARALSRKFVTLYELSRELLSKQKHYDWGLRAVKSVLRQAGKLKRSDPDLAEDPLLMRALRDFNMPKIVTDDKPIFLRLIGDLFPKIEVASKSDPELKKLVIETTKKDLGLIAEELFVLKVIQLSEILEVRHCCFIIGPPGCGKTTVWKTLAKVFNNKGEDCEYDPLNPKAVTSDELFGCYSKSKEWKNGVLSMIMKNQNKCEEKYKESHQNKWSILDGDIDPEWIESLNTVMDDNKVLTLVSNDRIPLTPSMRLLFEISNLKNATPATVSRGGVLYINDTDIGWMPYMNSWLDRSQYKKSHNTEYDDPNAPVPIDDVAKAVFFRCFQSYLEQNQEVHRIKHVAPVVDIMMVMTLCTILDALLKEHQDVLKTMKEDDQRVAYEALFIFAGMWAIGGSIGGGHDDEKDQKEFNSFWRSASKIKLPDLGLVFDYFYDPSKMVFTSWNTMVNPYEPQEELNFGRIFVATLHTTRLRYLMDVHVSRLKPILFIGSAGTGKTAVVKDYLASTKADKIQHKTMNFNSFTDSLLLQKDIELIVKKKSGRTYGSGSNKVLVYFIDDLNMPYVDKYGTQSPIALLRQIFDYGSIFNREQLEERKFLQDLLFMGSLNPKSGSFTIDLRLQRYFSVFTMFTPSIETIRSIYGSILGAHFHYFENPKIGDKVVDASISIFYRLLRDTRFSPSARKFQYQFNLRELSKICEGVMLSTPQSYRGGGSAAITRLWVHECRRVFEDRMISDDDIKVFRDYLKDSLAKNLGEENVEGGLEEPMIFTAFISVHHGLDRAYVAIDSMASLKKTLTEKLNEYNELKAQMKLVLFDQAMEHVCRIVRIIDFPGGNALLVGVGGSGKQSLSKLACSIVGYDIEQIVVTLSFNINDLRNFLQEVYKKIAKPGAYPRVFMITDSQIKDEGFLTPINDMLSSGWISDLFTKEDFDNMVQNLRGEAKNAGVADNQESLTTYFLDKMKRNLHLILCFSPVGENFRVKSRKFPGLINSTSVNWFHGWPKDALVDVAFRFLADIEFPTADLQQKIALNMAEVHTSIDEANIKYLKFERRYNYTTPKSFLELIDFYKKTLDIKRSSIIKQIHRFDQGLKILANTQSKVQSLQEDLKVKMVEVDKQKEETNILIEKVGRESGIAEEEQNIANAEEAKTNAATEEADKMKKKAEIALADAMPALERAKAAVSCLNKGHITEMKNLGSPPSMVITTAKAVLILLGEKVSVNDPDEKVWKKGQLTMNNPSKFIDIIANFNGEEIPENILDNVNKIIADSKFNEEFMKTQNYAASKLCSWVCNIVIFNTIFKKVKPLVKERDDATEQLELKKKDLAVVKERVRQLNEKVSALKRQYEEAETRRKKVEAEANLCLSRLQAAETLVNGLAGENKRWGENVSKLKENTLTIIGDVLLASAFVSYIGAFTTKFRNDLWQKKWYPDIQVKQIPITNGITPLKILTTESQMAKWKNEGLPADDMSLQNAAVINSCARWPLLIDPQLQGSTWIRGSIGENLNVISLNQNRWLNSLVNSIQMGKHVLIEGLQEEIDATLDPLLSRAIIKKGKNYILELGGDPIDYDPKFKLYLMTKLMNPHYRPEIAAQCTIINFIVTEGGLEEQLLASVVNIEKNELEVLKQELVKKQNDFQVMLDKLEESLLNSLNEADQDTILENTELIANLDNTKKTAIEIQVQSEKAKMTEIEINQQREIYRGVAEEGAMLYFLVISLNVIDHMYQYSLESFYKFFYKAIERTKVQDETRVEELRKNIRYTIYQWISRGLFERHKLIFLTLITFRLMQKKIIDVPYEPAQMDFLIKCLPKAGIENPLEWLPVQAWDCVQGLIQLEEFRSFAQNMEKDAPNRFRDWYNELAPEDQKLPLDWKKLDNTFGKLLVLRCLRPDRITIALTNFIKNNLPQGETFVEMDQKLSFEGILESAVSDSDSSIPIFFILSPGADPVKEVEKIAKRNKIEPGKSFFSIALGQGQGDPAKRRIEDGLKEGHWVMLQNIHLMPTWLIELEKILDSFSGESGGGNEKFRLFLSAEPSKGVPIGILDRSIKLTNEPPAGLKANMKRAWTYFSKDEIEDKDPKIKSILFALCYFHSTVIERRRFGPKGWNMFYPFNIGDLRDSYLVLNKYIEQNQNGKVPFEDLIYIFGEIMYGGHIVDDWDRRLARAYLDHCMNENLFDELELFPYIEGKNYSFKTPPPNSYDKYIEHIELSLTQETPLAYGLHPNAEIGFRTTQCNTLFSTLIEIQPPDSSSSGEERSTVRTKNEIAADTIRYILEDQSMKSLIFNIEDIKVRIDVDSKGPYQNVFLQEVEYMNTLLIEIVRSLEEINQGFQGILTISEKMEQVIDSISLNRVPATWTVLAYPSKRGLASWLVNLFKRIEQLNLFRDDPLNIPRVIMISRLFNPQSFLTAIKQVVGSKNGLELNKLYIQTEFTKKAIEEIDTIAKDGAYVFGFILEGARWDVQLMQMEESRPKEMFFVLPVICCKAMLIPNDFKEDRTIYQCPAYKTEDRGNTYVFTAQLKTRYHPRKWILAGVAILMDVEGVAEEFKKK